MCRTKLKDRKLPDYTKGEEIFNMVSHIVGGGMGIVAVVLCVVVSAIHRNVYGVVSGAVFGGTMILLYCMSSIYHGLSPKTTAKKVFQVIDHCTIFILIAGTYTPITLCTLREYNTALGWTMFGIVWGVAILGIVLNSIDLKRFSVFSIICYLALGWCVVSAAKPVFRGLTAGGTWLLVSGGISYTVGAVIYTLGHKARYLHSVFHIFCVIGSLLHFLCILFYVV